MKLCLTIGIGKTDGLAPLPGAPRAAREMSDWALQAGFQVKLLTDEGGEPVSLERIRTAFKHLMAQNEPIDLFLLHFAGHGGRQGVEDNFWYPGDWKKEERLISVEMTRRSLGRYGITKLAIISDACRTQTSAPGQFVLDTIIPPGKVTENPMHIDRFNACLDGREAHMVPCDGLAPARCIFSTVMLEGLHGLSDAAYENDTDCVSSTSLATFSQERTQEIGGRYGLNLSAETFLVWRKGPVIYHRRDATRSPPVFRWPEPQRPSAPAPEQTRPRDGTISRPVSSAPRARLQRLKDLFTLGRDYRDTGINLVVLGQQPKRVLATVPGRSAGGRADEFRLELPPGQSAQLLVDFGDGMVASTVVQQGGLTVLGRDSGGILGWLPLNPENDAQNQLDTGLDLMQRLLDASLRARDAEGLLAAAPDRQHPSPLMHVLAAYLHEYRGDLAQIQTVADRFQQNGQPLPYDIALLARLLVKGPPLPLGGLWPWLRQGFDLMAETEVQDIDGNAFPDALYRHLHTTPFTAFKPEGTEHLARHFRMKELQ